MRIHGCCGVGNNILEPRQARKERRRDQDSQPETAGEMMLVLDMNKDRLERDDCELCLNVYIVFNRNSCIKMALLNIENG